jgi:serine/threonine protein kinase
MDVIAPLGGSDPRRLGPFRLHGVLGNGGTGTVYLGRGAPRRGGRKETVAVRGLRPELLRDRQQRARLRQESQIIADSVRSPFLAAPLDCEPDSERPWLATEYVPGLPLTALVSRFGPMPEEAVRALGGALCRVLVALHGAGLLHGDLRPQNVLLAAEAPKVVDTGFGPDLTGGGSAAERTIAMSQEVFAMGAVLVFAATGHPPFRGGPRSAVHDWADLSGVPEGLHPALLACLHHDPGYRPQPGALARVLDLADTAERPATDWLPEAYLHEIGVRAEAARKLTGRHFFGR